MRISDWSSDVCSSDLVILASTISHVERLVDDETQRGTCEIDGLITAIDSDLAGAGLHPDAGDCVLPAASRIGAAELVEFLLTEWRSSNRRFRDRCCWHRSVSSSRSGDVLQVGK